MRSLIHIPPSGQSPGLVACRTCCLLPCLPPQVVLAHALLQWPYLSDLTLVSAIISVFHREWGLAPKLPPAWLQLKRTPWLYFNLVLTDSQVCSGSRGLATYSLVWCWCHAWREALHVASCCCTATLLLSAALSKL